MYVSVYVNMHTHAKERLGRSEGDISMCRSWLPVPLTKSIHVCILKGEPRFLALTFLSTNLPQFSLGNSVGPWARSKGLLMFSSVEDEAFIWVCWPQLWSPALAGVPLTMNPGYHFLSSEVWAAYLDFMFFRKFLAFSMCAFSVSSWLCCLSWSRSLSRLTSWAWQPFPSQEKHRRMLVTCRSHISRAEVQACEEGSVTTLALSSTYLQALLCPWYVLLTPSTSPRTQLREVTSRTFL